jgi:hypothetical protein
VFLEEAIEGQALLAEPRDEAAQSGKAPQHLLHPFEVPDRTHSFEGRNLLGVGLNSPLGDDVSKKHASRHSEDTLFGV